MLIADLNGDGWLDVAVGNDRDVSVFDGDGSGNLRQGRLLSAGVQGIWEMVAADIDRDGRIDLAANSNGNSSLGIILNHGNGQWQMIPSTPLKIAPLSIASGDLNGDGLVDLVSAGSNAATGGVAVCLNRGSINFEPTFAAPRLLETTKYARSCVVVDLDGDEVLDLLVTEGGYIFGGGAEVSYLRGKGDGTFEPRISFETGKLPQRAVVVDLDGDARPDIVTANLGGDLSVLLNSSQ